MNMKSTILYRLSPIRRRQRSLYPERFREKIKAYVKRADTCSLGHGTWILGGDSTRAARVRADDAFLRPLRNSPDLSTHKMTTCTEIVAAIGSHPTVLCMSVLSVLGKLCRKGLLEVTAHPELK
jgi:hypothetical protein